jgi:hypothetical protein
LLTRGNIGYAFLGRLPRFFVAYSIATSVLRLNNGIAETRYGARIAWVNADGSRADFLPGTSRPPRRLAMELRWIVLIALWTLLSGPIFGGASGAKSARLAGKSAAMTMNHAKKIAKP